MFKRSEESEWSRFSKAFTGKEKDLEEKENGTPEVEVAPSNDETSAAAIVTSPGARPPASDTNLTVSRSGREGSSAVHTTYSADDVESIIGEHTFFDGTYKSENSIRVRGVAQGEIECSKAVFIEENAKVSAKVTAASITVAGEVSGELNCSGRVEVRPSGRITGTINAGVLVMQEGAFFDGNLRMRQEIAEAAPSAPAAPKPGGTPSTSGAPASS
jgi:cytoskeletal protein CcmA (bactofilin family)